MNRPSLRIPRLCLAIALSACGARTGLDVPDATAFDRVAPDVPSMDLPDAIDLPDLPDLPDVPAPDVCTTRVYALAPQPASAPTAP